MTSAAVEAAVIQKLAPPGQVPRFTVTALVTQKAERAIKPEVDRTRGVRGHRRTGHVAHRGSGARSPAATRRRRPRRAPRARRRSGDDDDGQASRHHRRDRAGGGGGLRHCRRVVPAAPLGPVRSISPDSGVDVDWTVLGIGALVIVALLGAVAFGMSRVGAHLMRRRAARRSSEPRESQVTHLAARANLSPAALTGVRFALRAQGGTRRRVPVRSAIVTAALAIAVVVATVTFGSSLATLVSQPSLYGWNWNYEVDCGQRQRRHPRTKPRGLLDHDRSVAAWTGVYFGSLEIDGQAIARPRRHAPRADHATDSHRPRGRRTEPGGPGRRHPLSSLHKHVGDIVSVTDGRSKAVPPPDRGDGHDAHDRRDRQPAPDDRYRPRCSPSGCCRRSRRTRSRIQRPVRARSSSTFVRGTPQGAAVKALDRIAEATSSVADFGVAVVQVQRPAEIVNYRSMGSHACISLGAALDARRGRRSRPDPDRVGPAPPPRPGAAQDRSASASSADGGDRRAQSSVAVGIGVLHRCSSRRPRWPGAHVGPLRRFDPRGARSLGAVPHRGAHRHRRVVPREHRRRSALREAARVRAAVLLRAE